MSSVGRSSEMKADAPFLSWWWRASSPRMGWRVWRGNGGCRGSVVEPECINCMLKRMESEVMRELKCQNRPMNGAGRVVCTHPRKNEKLSAFPQRQWQ